MTDVPFGFGPHSEDDEPGRPGSGGPGDLSGLGLPGFGLPGMPGAGGIPDDLAGKMPLFAALQQLLSAQSGPVNWDLARQMAVSALATGHRAPSPVERSQVTEAVRLADLWLDPVTPLPSGVTAVEAWSRVEWVERTLPAWSGALRPGRVPGGRRDGRDRAGRGGRPGRPAARDGRPARRADVRRAGRPGAGQAGRRGAVQHGRRPAARARPGPRRCCRTTWPRSAPGLERPADEVRLFLALREAAYHRLFGHVPWLRQRLFDAVDAYARGIKVDKDAIERAMSEVDPQDPESMQRALQGGMFEPSVTPDQQAALARLETAARAGRGLGRRRGRDRRRRPAARRRRAARDAAPAAGDRRAGRADLRHPGRAGAAAAPAARGGDAVADAARAARRSTVATRSGSTPTCCPAPTTWTTRRASSARRGRRRRAAALTGRRRCHDCRHGRAAGARPVVTAERRTWRRADAD